MKATLRQLLQVTAPVFPEAASLQLESGPEVVGRYFGASITSAFQPLFRPDSDIPAAWEAFARSRSRDGDGLSPWRLFADAAEDQQLVTLDRLCRAVHTLNFLAQAETWGERPLFLNIHPRLLDAVSGDHGAFFRAILSLLDVAPGQVVIDIPALGPGAQHRLRPVVANFRRQGFRVALAAGHRLDAQLLGHWVEPDFLRLPGVAWSSPETAKTVTLLARQGVQVIATHIESELVRQLARHGGAALLQGFWLGQARPGRELGATAARPTYSIAE
jgi:EAL domain-containing protein (putative c-di-GMP-specific phosphodiesterase class I)